MHALPEAGLDSGNYGSFCDISDSATRAGTEAVNDPEGDARRRQIAKDLEGRGHDMCFMDLLWELGLAADYKAFAVKNKDRLMEIAEYAPAFVGGKLHKDMREEQKMAGFDKGITGKKAIAATFKGLFKNLATVESKESRSTFVDVGTIYVSETTIEPSECIRFAVQDSSTMESVHIAVKAIPQTSTRAIPEALLGQAGDDALHMITHQPTRKFVPVLVLHGSEMMIIVFARNGYHVVDLGNYMRSELEYDSTELGELSTTLGRIAFLLSLPPERFGHIVDVSEPIESLLFPDDPVGGDLQAATRIQWQVRIDRRLAYLFRTQYQRKDAVLKLSWTPIDRLPEVAIYDYLKSSGIDVPGVPEVYKSGILIEDCFEYRLEYLILEDCGKSISDMEAVKSVKTEAALLEAIPAVTKCLLQARKAGVLHRDISAGNIAFSNGQIKVIDWGYAKLLSDVVPETARTVLATKWRFDSDTVFGNEVKHDPLTGTPLYMSIGVLLESPKRSVLDDLESLLYVVLHALWKAHAAGKETPIGFHFLGSRNMAFVRTGCLASPTRPLKQFGVTECPDELHAKLMDLYKLLFFQGSELIVGRLANGSEYVRQMDYAMLEKIAPGALPEPEPLPEPERRSSRLHQSGSSRLPSTHRTASGSSKNYDRYVPSNKNSTRHSRRPNSPSVHSRHRADRDDRAASSSSKPTSRNLTGSSQLDRPKHQPSAHRPTKSQQQLGSQCQPNASARPSASAQTGGQRRANNPNRPSRLRQGSGISQYGVDKQTDSQRVGKRKSYDDSDAENPGSRSKSHRTSR